MFRKGVLGFIGSFSITYIYIDIYIWSMLSIRVHGFIYRGIICIYYTYIHAGLAWSQDLQVPGFEFKGWGSLV